MRVCGDRAMVRRDPIQLKIIAQAFGARYPNIVAERIPLDCPDVPAAITALRERMPQWFDPTPASQQGGR